MSDRSSTMSSMSSQGGKQPHLTGGDLLGMVENAVRENPVSACLIGMGALWLFMGGTNVSLFGNGHRRSVFGTLQSAAEATAHAAQSGVSAVGHSVANAAQQMGNVTAQTIHDAAAATGTTARDLASRSGEAVTALERKGEKWGGALQRNIEALLDQQPLALGVLGIAIGVGIAASLPTTEAERSFMGEASDMLQNQFSDVAGQVNELASSAMGEIKARM